MNRLLNIILFTFLLIAFTDCDDTVVQEVDNRTIPDSNVSFSKNISPIFELKCNSCHGNGKTEAGLNLTSPAYFVDGIIVVPGEPDNSVLVWTIEWKAGFPSMPPPDYSVPLTSEQIRGVKTWITEGAKDN
ncbi:planctomycete cytochrome C [bacterium BMS3Abin03]|nr:planctomycete cytochrome C [bacterium BMS3Abin03]